MKEELPKNPDVLHKRQIHTITSAIGRPVNRQRCYVSAGPLILCMLPALAGLCLWLLRLLGLVQLPF